MQAARWITLLLTIYATGCATRYQPQSYTGGFQETALAPNAFEIRFVGNGYTDAQRAADFALLSRRGCAQQWLFLFRHCGCESDVQD